MDDYDLDEPDMLGLDEKNKQRSLKNILSKRNVSKYELDEIFANY